MSRKSGDELQEHMLGTYFSLRLGLAVIGIALPIVVFAAGWWNCGAWFEGSISAYYHTSEHHTCTVPTFIPRDLFVGGLFAVATCLYLYKGYSTAENVALNLAGVAAAVVALFPTAKVHPVHVTAAVLFFVCIAYVSLFRSHSTLDQLEEEKRPFYRRSYRTTGILMILMPLAAILLDLAKQDPGGIKIFWAETFGVWAFAAYWMIKTAEMHESQAEKLAAAAILPPAGEPAREPAKGSRAPVAAGTA